MENLIMYKKGEQSWIRWIQKRLKNNLNFLALFQGPTGVGKTWSAMSVSQMLDAEFSVDQIVFDFKELMEVINSDWFQAKKTKVIIFDEPQITISNRAWQSQTNKLMNFLLSTFRHQNIIVFFCAPYSDFLDSQSTKLLHCIFECVGVNVKKNKSKLKGKIQQYNAKMKKTYEHYLRVIKNKKVNALKQWSVGKPTKELIDLYEAKKTRFTTELNREIVKSISELSKNKDLAEIDRRKSLTNKQREVMEAISNTGTQQEAADLLGCGVGTVNFHKQSAEKKGYSLQEFENA